MRNAKRAAIASGSLSTISNVTEFRDMAGKLVGAVALKDMYEEASVSSFPPCLLLRKFPREAVERMRQHLKL